LLRRPPVFVDVFIVDRRGRRRKGERQREMERGKEPNNS
jgi:hypothetical protein